MVELIAAIAIVAILVAVMVPAIGNFVETSRRTADRQTLAVLNDALNRYKMQGGDISALTSGASVGNVLSALQAPVSWAGVTHQFLKAGTTYTAASISSAGEGAQYRFSRYGTYADGTVIGNSILPGNSDFNAWLAEAFDKADSTDYVVLTNPSSSLLFKIDVRVVNSGDKVEVWWDDGTTESFSPSTNSNSPIHKTYSTAADRTVVIVGNISRFESHYWDGGTTFSGDLTTLQSVTYLATSGACQAGGDIGNLPESLKTLSSNSSNYSGSLADLPRGVTKFTVNSDSTITGTIADLPSGLLEFYCNGQAGITGDVADLPSGITRFTPGGDGTYISGDVSNISPSMVEFGMWRNNLTGNIANVPSTIKDLLIAGDNTVTYATTSGTHTWPSSMERIYLRPSATGILTSAMVDALLIDLSAVTTWKNEKFIDLQGNCAARTSASDAAVATLQGNGVTVTTN